MTDDKYFTVEFNCGKASNKPALLDELNKKYHPANVSEGEPKLSGWRDAGMCSSEDELQAAIDTKHDEWAMEQAKRLTLEISYEKLQAENKKLREEVKSWQLKYDRAAKLYNKELALKQTAEGKP